jgi:hypothetical protein
VNTRGAADAGSRAVDWTRWLGNFGTGTLNCALHGAGACRAYRCSLNGHSRRYVLAQTSRELLNRLRAIEMSQ